VRVKSGLFCRAVAVGALSLSGVTLVTLVPTSAIGPAWENASRVSASSTRESPLTGVNVLGWGFDEPWAITSDGTHVWVANRGKSVTEISASTGTLVQVIRGSRYGFDGSLGITSDGTHIWVANPNGQSVTELSTSTGTLVKVIRGSRYGFDDPWAVASDGTHIWVTNESSVTELSASTGALVRVIRGSRYGFVDPVGHHR
jgi:DNA-binding beta-propeller fold protein YncE